MGNTTVLLKFIYLNIFKYNLILTSLVIYKSKIGWICVLQMNFYSILSDAWQIFNIQCLKYLQR